VIWGTGFWLKEPARAYLDALGATRDEMADPAGTLGIGRRAGLVPLEPVSSTAADWDRYEARGTPTARRTPRRTMASRASRR
jgi:hypothetical protein